MAMEMKFCENCGAKMPVESKFCTECGTPFPKVEEKKAQPAPAAEEKPVEQPAEQPVERPVEQPVEASIPAPAEQPIEVPRRDPEPPYTPAQPVNPTPAQPTYSQPAQPAQPVNPQPRPAQPVNPTPIVTPAAAPNPAPAYTAPAYSPYDPEITKETVKGTKYEPISPLGWVGIFLLVGIPLVGPLLVIIWACCGCRKQNKRTYARGILITWLIGLIIAALLGLALKGKITSLAKDYAAQNGIPYSDSTVVEDVLNSFLNQYGYEITK